MAPRRRFPPRYLILLAALPLAVAQPAAAAFYAAPALDTDAAREVLASGTPIRVAVWWQEDPADLGRRYALARGRGEDGPLPPAPESWRGHQQALCPSGTVVEGWGAGWTLLRVDSVESLDRLLPPTDLAAPAVRWPREALRPAFVPISPPGIEDPDVEQGVPAPLPEAWEAPVFDCAFARGHREATWLYGDWNGDGAREVGKYVEAASLFLLDANGNGRWDGPEGGDRRSVFAPGFPLAVPLVGDWNGDGRDGIGKQSGFASSSGTPLLLDANENGAWDGVAGGDRYLLFARGLEPLHSHALLSPFVVGDWNGDGADEVGRYSPSWALFLLDANGNGAWDGPAAGDRRMDFREPASAAYRRGWTPIVGDWNGDGADGVGQTVLDWFLADLDEDDRWGGPEVDLDLVLLRPMFLPLTPVPCTPSEALPLCW